MLIKRNYKKSKKKIILKYLSTKCYTRIFSLFYRRDGIITCHLGFIIFLFPKCTNGTTTDARKSGKKIQNLVLSLAPSKRSDVDEPPDPPASSSDAACGDCDDCDTRSEDLRRVCNSKAFRVLLRRPVDFVGFLLDFVGFSGLRWAFQSVDWWVLSDFHYSNPIDS